MNAAAARLLGEDLVEFSPVSGGQNSKTFKARTTSGRLAAVKVYFQDAGDYTDRLDVEFRAFSLVAASGLGPVPRPLARDDTARMAAYEWIDGIKLDPAHVSDSALDQFVAFAGELFRLRAAQPDVCVWPARAACIVPTDILTQIDRRISRLGEAVAEHSHGPGLKNFLHGEFVPEFFRRRDVFFEGCRAVGLNPDAPIPEAAQTLSPSDFGLHNALAGSDGRLTFLDFEYFGRDDPAKLTADFLLHPAMTLSSSRRRRFLDGAAKAFADCPGYAGRLSLLLPLTALKWCVILLNEFLPERLARRSFASGQDDLERALSNQLEKAHRMLATSKHLHEEL